MKLMHKLIVSLLLTCSFLAQNTLAMDKPDIFPSTEDGTPALCNESDLVINDEVRKNIISRLNENQFKIYVNAAGIWQESTLDEDHLKILMACVPHHVETINLVPSGVKIIRPVDINLKPNLIKIILPKDIVNYIYIGPAMDSEALNYENLSLKQAIYFLSGNNPSVANFQDLLEFRLRLVDLVFGQLLKNDPDLRNILNKKFTTLSTYYFGSFNMFCVEFLSISLNTLYNLKKNNEKFVNELVDILRNLQMGNLDLYLNLFHEDYLEMKLLEIILKMQNKIDKNIPSSAYAKMETRLLYFLVNLKGVDDETYYELSALLSAIKNNHTRGFEDFRIKALTGLFIALADMKNNDVLFLKQLSASVISLLNSDDAEIFNLMADDSEIGLDKNREWINAILITNEYIKELISRQ